MRIQKKYIGTVHQVAFENGARKTIIDLVSNRAKISLKNGTMYKETLEEIINLCSHNKVVEVDDE